MSTCKWDTNALEIEFREMMIYYINAFEETHLTGVLHRQWSHLAQTIELNNGFGLGLVGESPIERDYEIFYITFIILAFAYLAFFCVVK